MQFAFEPQAMFNKNNFLFYQKYRRHSTKAIKSIDSTRTLGTTLFTITQ